ncbi:MAG TPA: Ig-like domain-containing protein [Alistipes sp.]|uniref:Ig-like domain-containing protein n=1 Tax=unclassified Alistipes TaxID=2608932 RepID=UPI0025878570|nr:MULTISPECIES: Ig-like domain-containing protein [unclassified Alistipes]HUN13568.1 Ig-like domain-containing protein [Alistipes sp.]
MKSAFPHTLSVLRAVVVLFFASAFFSRCASMMIPTGGPRDTLPPVIVNMTPDNFSTDRPLVGHGKIYIEFDEFVQLKDQQKEFFTSPQMKKKPTVTLRGRGIVIQLRDTLLPNTTYALNFGSALRDNNEGNPLHSMRYVFSTGPEIDSMILSGYTADAYKADSVSKTFIWFFPADSVEDIAEYDSTIFKYKPAVIARAENNGIFIAQNLKPVPYRVYAVQDKNDNQLYEPGSDQVGFLDGTYNPAALPDFAMWYDSLRHYVSAEPQLYLRMFTDRAFRRQVLAQSERPLQHKALLYFSAPHPQIDSIRFDSIPEGGFIVDPQTVGRDTLALWFTVPSAQLPDTLRGSVTYFKHDSVNVLRRVTEPLKLSWRFIETKEQQREREKLERERRRAEEAGEEWTEPRKPSPFAFKLPLNGEINPENHLTVDFDYPLARLDSAAMLLTLLKADNSVEDVPVRFVRDTALLRRWYVRAPWKSEGQYTLTIPAGAITDVAGFTNDSIVGKYTVLDPEKFATVKIDVRGREGMQYIVQLLDGSGSLKQERRGVVSGPVRFNYVSPGEIKFRVIEDLNGNGKWDSGDVVARRQPERAEMFVDEQGGETFATKANWDIEFTMDMPRIFAPVTMQSLSRLLDERELQRLRREEEKRAKEGPQRNDVSGSQSGAFQGGMGSMGGFGGRNAGMFQGMR